MTGYNRRTPCSAQTIVLETTKFVESLQPVKQLFTRRFLKEKSLKCRTAEDIKSIVFKIRSTAVLPPESKLQVAVINPKELPRSDSEFSWEDAFICAIPLDDPVKHEPDSKTCLCESCVENCENFDMDHLFSDDPLEFDSELKDMMLELDDGNKVETEYIEHGLGKENVFYEETLLPD